MIQIQGQMIAAQMIAAGIQGQMIVAGIRVQMTVDSPWCREDGGSRAAGQSSVGERLDELDTKERVTVGC